MMVKLSEMFGKPIKIVLDNARYQRCNLVIVRAVELGVELIFLPTYSPNLNLIERVWKLVKGLVLNSAYHATFDDFCGNIFTTIEKLHIENIAEMRTIITDKFHIVETDEIENLKLAD